MDLYQVTTDYVKYLQKFEPKKILSNSDNKSSRKFFGIIVQKNGYKYVVPLSSPKYKKDYEIEGYTSDGYVDVGFQKRRAHRSVLKMDYAYRGRRDDGGGRGVLFQDVYAASGARTFRCGTVRQIFPENKQGETRFRLIFSGAVRGACSYDIQGREYL